MTTIMGLDECPSINIRQPQTDLETELKDLLRYRIDTGYIQIEDYFISRADLLISWKYFIVDYIFDAGNPAYNLRTLKWQNY